MGIEWFGAGLAFGGGETNQPTLSPSELGYSVKRWTMEDGLPGRTVTSLAQTPDGFLWGGTRQGLFRFDGTQFRNFYSDEIPALRDIQILEMRCDPAGRLWIEGSVGELVVYQSGHFHRFEMVDGVPPDQAGKLGESRDGSFWCKGRTNDCFYHYVNGRFQAVTYPGIPASSIDRFYADREGVRWGIDEKRRVMVRFTPGGPEYEPLIAPDRTSSVWAGRLFWLQDGSLGVTSSHGIYFLDGDQWKPRCRFEHPLAPTDILSGVQDRQGEFWVSVYDRGLVRIRPNGRTEFVSLPNSNRRLFYRDLLVDGEGSVWVGGSDGLYRLRYNTFHAEPASLLQTRQREANGFVQDAQGRLWILYDKGWARQTKTGWEFTSHDRSGNLYAGAPSKDGSVYLAYLANPATTETLIEEQHPDGTSQTLGRLSGYPLVMLESRSRDLWVGTDEGLWRLKAGGFTRVKLSETPASDVVRGLAEDPDGRILAGVWQRGLYRRDRGGRWQLLTGPNDRGSQGIAGICLGKHNTVWAAIDTGLARYRNGQWYAFSGRGVEFPRNALSVVTDQAGGLWISAMFGVTRMDLNALNARADGQDVPLAGGWFDSGDGLPSANCTVLQGSLCRTSDGRIWVGTFSGAAVVDPMEPRQRQQRLKPPPVHIESVQADDQTLMDLAIGKGPKPGEELMIPPGARRIAFRYTAADLSGNKKNRFRYRIEGLGEEWVDAGEQRAAVYHRLPPGHYRFQVTAANRYGVRNDQGATLAFYLQPYWWQVRWFQAVAALAIVGMIGFGVRRRIRRLERERARQKAFSRQIIDSQEQERNRIARELHDGLGQNLLAAKNMALLGSMKPPPAAEIGQRFQEISDTLGSVLNEVRGISRALRPAELDNLGLTKALRTMLRRLEATTELEVNADIEAVDQLLAANDEINLYRLIQESLNNVIRHSGATRIHCTVTQETDTIRATISDDGKGFDVVQVREQGRAGLGLLGMEERARLMDGRLEIQSAPGQGTRIAIAIPVKKKTDG